MRIFPYLLFLLLAGLPAMAQKQVDSIAERMLLFQKSYGGWPKAVNGEKVDYEREPDQEERNLLLQLKSDQEATIDNHATSREIIYLFDAYNTTQNPLYLQGAMAGIHYVLRAQYANGGWPQYFPDTRYYRSQVTFNDNAMINVLQILYDVAQNDPRYIAVDSTTCAAATVAAKKAIACILATQVKLGGRPTIWAAQYDKESLEPAKARAFELASLCTGESVGILLFLMNIKQPEPAVQEAIHNGIAWMYGARIDNLEIQKTKDVAGNTTDVQLVPDNSSVIWARFYDLKEQKPLFAGRDGIARATLAEIEAERRNGYAWYGHWGSMAFDRYFQWLKENNITAPDQGLVENIRKSNNLRH